MRRMEKENKFLTAEEAKHLADTSHFVVNQVYKSIKESAKENQTYLSWHVEHMSEEAIENLNQDLKSKGYATRYWDGNLEISWWNNFGIFERKKKHENNI